MIYRQLQRLQTVSLTTYHISFRLWTGWKGEENGWKVKGRGGEWMGSEGERRGMGGHRRGEEGTLFQIFGGGRRPWLSLKGSCESTEGRSHQYSALHNGTILFFNNSGQQWEWSQYDEACRSLSILPLMFQEWDEDWQRLSKDDSARMWSMQSCSMQSCMPYTFIMSKTRPGNPEAVFVM